MDGMLPPGSTDFAGSMTYHRGTDQQGRDMLSAIIFGLRMSLGVGVMSTFIALYIGMSIGVLAAYFGGKDDTVLMRVVDLQLSFPSIRSEARRVGKGWVSTGRSRWLADDV